MLLRSNCEYEVSVALGFVVPDLPFSSSGNRRRKWFVGDKFRGEIEMLSFPLFRTIGWNFDWSMP